MQPVIIQKKKKKRKNKEKSEKKKTKTKKPQKHSVSAGCLSKVFIKWASFVKIVFSRFLTKTDFLKTLF